MKRLHALAADGILAPIDVELGSLMARRAAGALSEPSDVAVVALAAALLSAERGRGHSCLDLATVAGITHGADHVGIPLPGVADCRAILTRSGLCAAAGASTPLVLDGDRLYLHRYHAAERRVAAAIRERLASPAEPVPAATAALFRALFEVGPDAPLDWQAVAAAAALRGRLTVVTGGPGTGKTYTVARILALLLHRDPTLRIAVAAPTGKAAMRLAESIRTGAAGAPIPDALRSALAVEGTTLHRLLGYQPWNDRFVHGARDPLGEDVVVVDEASMVDLLMMDAVFAALRPSARIILLGDQDQLASVDTGSVLGDVCRAADACGDVHGAELGRWYAGLSGQRLDAGVSAPPLRDAVVRLTRSRRFEERPGIGALATAIRVGDSQSALATLTTGGHVDVAIGGQVHDGASLMSTVAPLVDAYLEADTPVEALARLAAFRVLSALRDGAMGVTGLNAAIERWLRAARGRSDTRAPWYHLRPVLVTANDPSVGLYNGDVGVTFRGADGRMMVHFPGSDATTPRAVSPARLPAHETAWAMTVHKSQGSEFSEVLLVLPEFDTRVLTRELLYTGVTRARARVTVLGSADVLRAGIGRTTARASGLAERLLDAAAG